MINILTGPVHSGKTTLLKTTIPFIKKQGFQIEGYLSEAVWENQKCAGYNLFDLKHCKSHTFLRKNGKKAWERTGPFYFLPETLAIAQNIINQSRNADLCVVDELGPLELSGKGIWPVLEEILFFLKPHFILVVRDGILKNFMEKIRTCEFRIFSVEKINMPGHWAQSLVQKTEKSRQTEKK